MKIATYHLGIELTQRCNLDCKHCFKGEMHNVNISRKILEKVFDEIKYGICTRSIRWRSFFGI